MLETRSFRVRTLALPALVGLLVLSGPARGQALPDDYCTACDDPTASPADLQNLRDLEQRLKDLEDHPVAAPSFGSPPKQLATLADYTAEEQRLLAEHRTAADARDAAKTALDEANAAAAIATTELEKAEAALAAKQKELAPLEKRKTGLAGAKEPEQGAWERWETRNMTWEQVGKQRQEALATGEREFLSLVGAPTLEEGKRRWQTWIESGDGDPTGLPGGFVDFPGAAAAKSAYEAQKNEADSLEDDHREKQRQTDSVSDAARESAKEKWEKAAKEAARLRTEYLETVRSLRRQALTSYGRLGTIQRRADEVRNYLDAQDSTALDQKIEALRGQIPGLEAAVAAKKTDKKKAVTAQTAAEKSVDEAQTRVTERNDALGQLRDVEADVRKHEKWQAEITPLRPQVASAKSKADAPADKCSQMLALSEQAAKAANDVVDAVPTLWDQQKASVKTQSAELRKQRDAAYSTYKDRLAEAKELKKAGKFNKGDPKTQKLIKDGRAAKKRAFALNDQMQAVAQSLLSNLDTHDKTLRAQQKNLNAVTCLNGATKALAAEKRVKEEIGEVQARRSDVESRLARAKKSRRRGS